MIFGYSCEAESNCMGRSEGLLTDNGVYVTSHGIQENWAEDIL